MIKLDSSATYKGDNVYSYKGKGEGLAKTAHRGTSTTYDIQIQNDGSAVDSFRIRGSEPQGRFAVKYFKGLTGSEDITSGVKNGSYVTSELAPGESAYIRMVITVKSNASVGTKKTFKVTANSVATTGHRDRVTATVKAS